MHKQPEENPIFILLPSTWLVGRPDVRRIENVADGYLNIPIGLALGVVGTVLLSAVAASVIRARG